MNRHAIFFFSVMGIAFFTHMIGFCVMGPQAYDPIGGVVNAIWPLILCTYLLILEIREWLTRKK